MNLWPIEQAWRLLDINLHLKCVWKTNKFGEVKFVIARFHIQKSKICYLVSEQTQIGVGKRKKYLWKLLDQWFFLYGTKKLESICIWNVLEIEQNQRSTFRYGSISRPDKYNSGEMRLANWWESNKVSTCCVFSWQVSGQRPLEANSLVTNCPTRVCATNTAQRSFWWILVAATYKHRSSTGVDGASC